MRVTLTAAATFLAILSAGCDKRPSESEPNAANEIEVADTINTTAPASTPLASADFANAVAGNGKFEIDSAALAATNAGSAEVKSLAAMISADHKRAGEDLKAAAETSNPSFTPLTSLNPKQTSDLAALRGLTGTEFDRLYVTQQIAAHQEAVSVLSSYVAGGTSQQLKDFASKVLPKVQSHLERLNALPK